MFVKQKNTQFKLDKSLLEQGRISDYIRQIRVFVNRNNSSQATIKILKQVINHTNNLKLGIKTKILTVVLITLLNTLGQSDSVSNVNYATIESEVDDYQTLQTIEYILTNLKRSKLISSETGNIDDFLDKLAEKESSNNWKILKITGSYIGKYQFGEAALHDVGLNISPERFRKNPNIFPESFQDKAVKDLLYQNHYYLKNYIDKYQGKIINGILMTESGILAGAHLMGAKNTMDFLDTHGEYLPADGFGTPITEYMYELGGYELNI